MTYDPELVRQAGVRRAVRIRAVQAEGFTPRQAAFLVEVMVHAGVFLERQYCTFAGITHGEKTHDFLRRLTGCGFAREIRPGALHRARFYHVHHKRLYAVIREPDNRNRRRAPIGALASRLMLLDMVLDDPSRTWLGAHDDKVAYFTGLSRDVALEPVDLPYIPFGTGRRRVLRTFPDKLPIGVPTDSDEHVFTYLATRRQPVDFRAFLARHFMLWTRGCISARCGSPFHANSTTSSGPTGAPSAMSCFRQCTRTTATSSSGTARSACGVSASRPRHQTFASTRRSAGSAQRGWASSTGCTGNMVPGFSSTCGHRCCRTSCSGDS